DRDRLAVLQPERPLCGVERVRDRQQLDRRAELDPRPDLDEVAVQHDAAGVGIEALADVEVRAVVAEERRPDPRARADAAPQPAQDRAAVIPLLLAGAVVAREQGLRPLA